MNDAQINEILDRAWTDYDHNYGWSIGFAKALGDKLPEDRSAVEEWYLFGFECAMLAYECASLDPETLPILQPVNCQPGLVIISDRYMTPRYYEYDPTHD